MPGRQPRLSGKEMLAVLKRSGWFEVSSKGGHRQLRHLNHPGKVTIPIHGTTILPPWILKSILDQSAMTTAELEDLL